jgi:hypothetical protein
MDIQAVFGHIDPDKETVMPDNIHLRPISTVHE